MVRYKDLYEEISISSERCYLYHFIRISGEDERPIGIVVSHFDRTDSIEGSTLSAVIV